MPLLADFEIIQGDAEVEFTGTKNFNFNTGGREKRESLLMISFSPSISGTSFTRPRVLLNGEEVGKLSLMTGDHADWQIQTVVAGPDRLNDGDNVLQIESPKINSGGHIPMSVKDIVCFFRQKSK
jgi:hypothetical protein